MKNSRKLYNFHSLKKDVIVYRTAKHEQLVWNVNNWKGYKKRAKKMTASAKCLASSNKVNNLEHGVTNACWCWIFSEGELESIFSW